jgi:hypothetical protein
MSTSTARVYTKALALKKFMEECKLSYIGGDLCCWMTAPRSLDVRRMNAE